MYLVNMQNATTALEQRPDPEVLDLNAVSSGDLQSTNVVELYQLERRRLRRSTARIVGVDLAEDVVHDAFVTFIDRAPQADRPGAWINRTARNRALKELRNAPTVPLSPESAIAASDLGLEVEREASRSVVHDALAALSERDRRALWLRYFEGYDNSAVARTLGMRTPAVAVLVHRATKRLGREIIRRLAEAHGAGDCATALARMAGVEKTGEAAEHHAPCRRCSPAWDEIAALRALPAMLPGLPLRALVDLPARSGLFRRLAERACAILSTTSEPIRQAVASVVVAAGIATATLAVPGMDAPFLPEPPAPVSVEAPGAPSGGGDQAPKGTMVGLPDVSRPSSADQLPVDGDLGPGAASLMDPPEIHDPSDPEGPLGAATSALEGARPELIRPDLAL